MTDKINTVAALEQGLPGKRCKWPKHRRSTVPPPANR